MASLKEIKGRIASVSGTLKITSAMKLVASAKLRKAQQAVGNMLPYERQLHRILTGLMAACQGAPVFPVPEPVEGAEKPARRVSIVAFASNSSLCGAFNSNAVKLVLSAINEYRAAGLRDEDIVVYSVGRKMQDAMRKAGFTSPADYSRLVDSPGYDGAAGLAQTIIDEFHAGRTGKVELIFNHYKSTASQVPTRETYLPFSIGPSASECSALFPDDVIVEPSPEAVLEDLIPKVLRLKIYTVLLDSVAAEHAARTVAMQTATDNGNDLLEELTLEYNKGRQQKITSEILDIVGGSMQ